LYNPGAAGLFNEHRTPRRDATRDDPRGLRATSCVQAATKLFIERDYDAVTPRTFLREAGASAARLYNTPRQARPLRGGLRTRRGPSWFAEFAELRGQVTSPYDALPARLPTHAYLETVPDVARTYAAIGLGQAMNVLGWSAGARAVHCATASD